MYEKYGFDNDNDFINGVSNVSNDDLFEMLYYIGCDGYYGDIWNAVLSELRKRTRQKGTWLIEGGTTLHYACSECGCAGDEWDKFCKHCGAKMSMRGDKYDT